jgi:outer membrane receptor for ferrienterochelin and colicin
MKKILMIVLMFSLAAVIGINPISAQEKNPVPVKEEKKAVKEEAAVEQKEAHPAEEKKEEPAKKSNVYTIGEIVIKEKAIANVEDAATTTVLSAEDLKSRSEKTLDQALQTVPGMIVKQGQKGQMNFDLRGFHHDTTAGVATFPGSAS